MQTAITAANKDAAKIVRNKSKYFNRFTLFPD